MARGKTEKITIIVIVGQTATGKSALAVRLARLFNGEIISADSRQVYRGLDIGTGKITKKEMRGVWHYLLDVASPRQQYSAARFAKDASRVVFQIARRGKLPIVCGGTGFYIDALLGRVAFSDVPPNLKLRKRLENKTAPELLAILKKYNPLRAEAIDPHNPRRLIRAIEVASCAHTREFKKTRILADETLPQYRTVWIGLTLPREELAKKIAIRLFSRMSRGMITEVKKLHAEGLSWKRMEELGLEYRYASRHLRGRMSKKEMADKLKTEICRYAKRQTTWFKRNKRIRWFSPQENGKIEKAVAAFLNG